MSRKIMHRRLSAIVLAASLGIVSALVQAPTASAAADVTAPVIKTNAAASFLVGGSISAAMPIPDWDGYTWDIPMLVKWSVTDNSARICSFQIYSMAVDSWVGEDENQQDYGHLLLSLNAAQPSPYAGQVVSSIADYDGSFGGTGDSDDGWYLVAEDCSGNRATAEVHTKYETTVLQEDNRKGNYVDWATDPGKITYTGTWSNVSCTCASWHSMKRTTAKNASFTFTRTYERDDHVALVMAKGPARGKFDVYVDGIKKATVDTYAATNTNRVIVWDTWMAAGKHTVRVVNLATSGRSRIDLDAILTN